MNSVLLSHPWIIPVVPATASVLILLLGSRLPRRGSELALGSMIAGVALSVLVTVQWITSAGNPVEGRQSWFRFGPLEMDLVTTIDGLAVLMLLLVSVISLAVQIYSTSYMRDDRRYTHFFAVMTVFTATMQWFVISGSTLQLIFGWEVMSLCSFLLIGHWWEEKRNVHAAMKAFLTTRASDIGLFVGVAVLFYAAGFTFDIGATNAAVLDGRIAEGLLLAGAIALFVAVIGKSAQFPLHTWLPDAMAGPTPMSALIHAATMVVAGVYLIARMFPVFDEAFGLIAPGEANVVAIVGAVTILVAAALAFVQYDIKKLLSYSTVSHLGFMVMALGVGAWTAAVFHLVTHAFAKSLLFLTSGNVSHTVHGFDLEKDMGGLRKDLPITHATFVIGAASLAGVVPLAGFWSKEQIVAQAGTNGYITFQVVALLGTFLTAAYMLRCYRLIFLGERRGPAVVKEPPRAFTGPCIGLAAVNIVLGLLYAPLIGLNLFEDWVTPSFLPETEAHGEWALVVVELGLIALALGIAVALVRSGVGPSDVARRFSGTRALYHVLYNRLYLDWFYDRVFVNGIKRGLAWVVHWVDHNVVDNLVDATGKGTVRLGRFIESSVDRRIVDGAVSDTARFTDGAGGVLSRVQSGKVQRYVGIMVGSLVALALVIAVGVR